MSTSGGSDAIPLFPLKELVLFPQEVRVLYAGREKSVAALQRAVAVEDPDRRGLVLVVGQKRATTGDPSRDDLYEIGTLTRVVQLLALENKTVSVLVEGLRRARIVSFANEASFLRCEYEVLEEVASPSVELTALVRSVQSVFKMYLEFNKELSSELRHHVAAIDDPSRLADIVAAHLPNPSFPARQELLEIANPAQRLEKLYTQMQREVKVMKAEKSLRTRVKRLIDQPEPFTKSNPVEQEPPGEAKELETRIREGRFSKEVQEHLMKELQKLRMMSNFSAEATVVRNYLDWVLALPWGVETKDLGDLKLAQTILDADHYGLPKVKERVIESLAIHKLTGKTKGPILCFVGPPGVGKTSLGRSIAKTLGRKFARIALGGVRDEVEIRGHRRTYIGAMPGKIIQSLKRAESCNPVILFDEIDKLGADFRGDPASALLEVLDPEQNVAFSDHYIDLDFDLSKVLFLCTANSVAPIPGPLLDRMEVVHISGYTEQEKLAIARRYLVPKHLEACGLIGQAEVRLDTSALRTIIRRYTREAGVRGLEREIASVFRRIARQVVSAEGPVLPYRIESSNLASLLGPPKVVREKSEKVDQIGLVNGLAWTAYGGEVLPSEAAVYPGKGKLVVTGMLKDLMRESVQAALTWVRARADIFGLEAGFFEKHDVHVHFPGPDPKDGPSAGVAIATAIVSAVTRTPVRQSVAMTGEITLRGRVHTIGGLKEKCLAAHRAGIETVIIPKENKRDLRELPRRIRSRLRIVLVERIDEVLGEALLVRQPVERPVESRI